MNRMLLLSMAFAAAALAPAPGPRGRPGYPAGEPQAHGRRIQIEGGAVIDEDTVRTAREVAPHSLDTPGWSNPSGFEHDVFTFARVIFRTEAAPGTRAGWGRRLGWWVDFPDADLNLSWRLQQLTAIHTDPDARVLKLSDPALLDYPLLYMEHAGYMRLEEDEIAGLRRHLGRGGALFVNDFWGREEWDGFAAQIERVLPNARWVELETSHPLFHCVYDLRGPMHRLRVPTLQFWDETFDPRNRESAPHRVYRGEGSDEMRVRAILDEAGRPVVLAIHNSDVSDGWEREAESDLYFNRFSETIAYPLAINVIFYLMTH